MNVELRIACMNLDFCIGCISHYEFQANTTLRATKAMKEGRGWGTPPKPPAGRPLHPFVWEGRVGGHPQSPRQGDPCTPLYGKGELGDTPKAPGRETPAPHFHGLTSSRTW